jgi:hypothetical protein
MLDHPAGAELPDPYAPVKEHLQHFYAGWETELSGKVYGDGLVDLVGEAFERRRRSRTSV